MKARPARLGLMLQGDQPGIKHRRHAHHPLCPQRQRQPQLVAGKAHPPHAQHGARRGAGNFGGKDQSDAQTASPGP